jgi:hypothetical protein
MASQQEQILNAIDRRYEIIGHLRFTRFDELLATEIRNQEVEDRTLMQLKGQLLQISTRFAAAAGISDERAVTVINDLIMGRENDPDLLRILTGFSSELLGLEISRPYTEDARIRTITLFMNTRAWFKSDSGEWVKVKDWTEEGTEQFTGSMMNAIESFIRNEKEGWPKRRSSRAAKGKDGAGAVGDGEPVPVETAD